MCVVLAQKWTHRSREQSKETGDKPKHIQSINSWQNSHEYSMGKKQCLQLRVLGKLGCCCSVTQACLTLCDHMDCSTPGLPVPHHLPKFAQVRVHCTSDAIQPSHPLMPSSLLLSIFPSIRDFFQCVGCPHQVTKILKLQLQHQSFQ